MKRPHALDDLTFTELAQFDLQTHILQQLNETLCREHDVVLLQVDTRTHTAVVGMLDPGDRATLDDIGGRLSCRVRAVQLNSYEIERALALGFATDLDADLGSADVHVGDADIVRFDRDQEATALLNDLLATGVRLGASDIHIEQYGTDIDVRYRIDGLLHQLTTPLSPANIRAVLGRVRVLARLDLGERFLPQDGHFRVHYGPALSGRAIDVRVAILPGVRGDNTALRLLDPAAARTTLDALGLGDAQRDLLQRALTARHGIIVVTGPSGSGKSTTLYACLRELASDTVKVVTVEDPVEFDIPKVSQHQVSPHLGFAEYTRAFMRQDPDVLMIGEVRDEATARMACRAALTGHLVLTSLHTNDAAGAIERFRDLGISSQTLAETVRLIVHQRLIRKQCAACRELPEGAARPGCSTCLGIGYAGRTGLFEMLGIDAERRRLIAGAAGSDELRGAGPGLADHARALVAAGDTTVEEVRRVLSDGAD